jgi:outer membrane protein OmpA-like peptidoglycan-associated protein
MTKPAFKTLEVIPAEYKTVVDTIVIKPASEKYVYKPSTYKTVTDTIWTKDGYDKLSILPSQFSDDVVTVEIKSESGKWVAGEKDPDCPSIDPEDCRILHYRASPAVNKEVPVKKLVKNETTSSKPINRKFILVKKEVEVSKAKYETQKIAAQKRAVSREVRVKNETTKSVTVPAEYTEVSKKKLTKSGGLTVWREVPCTLPKQGILLISYEVGSAKLTRASIKLIDKNLLVMLKEQPNSFVEIGSHTDARGSASSNQSLSEKRAKSVIEYLIGKDVDKDRLLAVGYGESQLMNECSDGTICSQAEHAVNRRTEFKLF